jgi:peptidoglycan hydrolase-like protein with peptidoglycan-binding domain
MPEFPSISRRTVLRALTVATGAVAVGSPAHAAVAGPDVTELQIRVAGWAAGSAQQTFLPISGVFDAATEAALRRFQLAYGLPADGAANPPTLQRLAALAKPDGSTVSFAWEQFAPAGGEPVRRLMYKLEALRRKLGDRKVAIVNAHEQAGAADITVAGLTTYAVYRVAQTCGFSGLGRFTQSWLHCDSRAEGSAGWVWADGVIA